MTSFNSLQKIVLEAPKYLIAKNVNYLTYRTFKLPSRYELLKQAASERYHLNWFNDAWGKTKKTIIENWEEAKQASLKKNKKLVDDASNTGGEISRKLKSATNKVVSQNESAADDISQAKNKAQRELAENWDAIRRANSKKNKQIVDDIKESVTSTVEDVSKLVKEKGKL